MSAFASVWLRAFYYHNMMREPQASTSRYHLFRCRAYRFPRQALYEISLFQAAFLSQSLNPDAEPLHLFWTEPDVSDENIASDNFMISLTFQ
jgi:hypothetical protein